MDRVSVIKSFGTFLASLLVLAVLAYGQTPPDAAAKGGATAVPAPSVAEQQEAIRLVRDVYAADYAKKTPKDRVALAKRLILAGNDEKAAGRFAAYSEARDVAAAAGDCDTALEAIAALAKSFSGVNDAAMRTAALATAEKAAVTPESLAAVAKAYLSLSDAALSNADIDAAVKLATSAEGPASRSGDAPLHARAVQHKKELKSLQTQFAGLNAARTKLAAAPDDPAANLLTGRFLCLVAGNWEDGLPNLSKGSDATLRGAALTDMNAAQTPEARQAVGEAWAALAEKQSSQLMKSRLRARASHWYRLALPDLAGLRKTKVEKRLAELDTVAGDEADAAGPPSDGKAPVLKLLETIGTEAPKELRPPPKGKWAYDDFRKWVKQYEGKTQVDGMLVIQEVTEPTAGNPAMVYFATIGPVRVEGASYDIRLGLPLTDPQQAAIFKQAGKGAQVHVRGTIGNLHTESFNSSYGTLGGDVEGSIIGSPHAAPRGVRK